MNQPSKLWVVVLMSLASSLLLLPAAEAVNATLEVDWDLVDEYEYKSATVGYTVEFYWNGTQSIYVQVGADDGCNASQAIPLVQNSSEPPATYTFTDEDVYTEVVFSLTEEDDCFANNTIIFAVNPSAADRPKDCQERKDALDTCMREAGALGAGIFACGACISTSVTGNTVRLGSGCLEKPDRACRGFVDCDCRGCFFEAAALGSCEIDKDRAEDCPITDCSAEVGEASDAFSIGNVFFSFGGTLLVSFLVSLNYY